MGRPVEEFAPEERRVIDAYRTVRNQVGDLCFSDAMTALGMAVNSVMKTLPPEERMAVAKAWAETFVRNVYAAIEINDA